MTNASTQNTRAKQRDTIMCVCCGEKVRHYNVPVCYHPYCLATYTMHTNEIPKKAARLLGNHRLRDHLQQLEAEEPAVEVKGSVQPTGHVAPYTANYERDPHDQRNPLPVLLRRRSKGPEDPGLRLVAGRDYAEQLGVEEDRVETHHAVLVWRCGCPQDTRATYTSLDELPVEPGAHNKCPVCGAAAVVVEEEES